MGLIHSRHDDILKWLHKAVLRDMGEIFLEQEIFGDPEKNRLDLGIVDPTASKVTVVNVTVSFEREADSL